MPKDTREKVTLSPEAYKALEVEAMLHNTSLKDTASKLILKAACPKCKEILDIMARPPKSTELKEPITQEQKVTKAKGPKGPMPSESPKAKGKKLSNDTMALARIKELWTRSPRPSYGEIAREIGYSKSTTADNVNRLKKRGELARE